ncbi:MAG: DUF2693 domain-containing protein [Prevotella sp.]|nr:DUF2693 domain-containing protein [Prevotella sp.]
MKQSIVISQSNIVKDAARFSTKSDMPTAMSKALELEVLRKRMMSGEVVRFLYLKADGVTLRMAVGTLQEDAVAANVKGNGVPKSVYGQFAYIDCAKLGWRSFRVQNFVGIID